LGEGNEGEDSRRKLADAEGKEGSRRVLSDLEASLLNLHQGVIDPCREF